jgi:hypothetical protein
MAGEFFVRESLYRLGHQPGLGIGTAKSIDILVRSKKGKPLEVSVRSCAGAGIGRRR